MKRDRIYYFPLLLGFILGIRGGFVALWPEERPENAQIFPYSAAVLPVADQKALQEGIRIESEQQLVSILEDYLS